MVPWLIYSIPTRDIPARFVIELSILKGMRVSVGVGIKCEAAGRIGAGLARFLDCVVILNPRTTR